MKYALFEFVAEKSCEIGETRWISREDPDTFDNNCWDFDKEIMITWPREFSKVGKKIVKSSIDAKSVECTTCVAKVIKFSDNYEDIRQHAKMYSETGSIATPHHGRGKRVSKKNARYLNTDDDDDDNDEKDEKTNKRQKKIQSELVGSAKSIELEKLKAKYNFTTAKDTGLEDGSDCESECTEKDDNEMPSLRWENANLKNQLEKKDKEIAHLYDVIKNLKDMPSLQDVVLDLKKEIYQLQQRTRRHGPTTLNANLSTSSPQPASPHSPSPLPSSPCPSSSSCPSSPCPSSTGASSVSDSERDFVTICPSITISKDKANMLKTKATAKDFVYALMSIIWSRDILYTHSITGKASNAFKEKDAKPQLDTEKVQSICEFASKKYRVTVQDVKTFMASKINNIVKVVNAKQKLEVQQGV